MSTVIDRRIDPISVESGARDGKQTVRLRIGVESGDEGRGSRLADLSSSEARILAYALLQAAERLNIQGQD